MIQNLRADAMRERHINAIVKEVKETSAECGEKPRWLVKQGTQNGTVNEDMVQKARSPGLTLTYTQVSHNQNPGR